ncbi:STAS domain-containing protein [Labilithrix luteola]|uniref:STAS domain-containing protein n=1 Tax=Labilithrix luteola TaxID=1391654 RepID=UPI0011BA9F8D|nr:STAS domain-containing protein [Labilithrix luteola]
MQRLREEREVLTRRLRRRSEALQFLQLMTKTFVSLSLTDRREISDTLNSLILTFLDARFGAIVLRSSAGTFELAASQGWDVDALTTDGARAVFAPLLTDKGAQSIDAARAEALWPGRPAGMRDGFAFCTIEANDAVVGLILAADLSTGSAASGEDLEFISAASGIGGMALTNARLLVQQQALMRDVQREAEQARREAGDKARALDELDRKLVVIEAQKSAIRRLSAPVLQIWDGVLAVPIVGDVDRDSSAEITERLLTEVVARRARFVIIDLTAVDLVDTQAADALLRVARSVQLLGTSSVLTGIRPAVAQAMVSAGVDMSAMTTLRNLRDGLAECLGKTTALTSGPRSDVSRRTDDYFISTTTLPFARPSSR